MSYRLNRRYAAGLFLLAAVLLLALAAEPASAATKTVKYGNEISIDLGDTIKIDNEGVSTKTFDTKYTWVKFKAKKTGYVKIRAVTFCDYIWLTNSSKKILSGDSSEGDYLIDDQVKNEYTALTYGVKRGRTYYLRIHADGLTDVDTIKTSFKAQGVTGGAKKSKAKSIKRNKWQKGINIAGTKHARWYKIKLTKSQKVSIYFKFYGCRFCSFYAWTKKLGGISRKIYRENLGQNFTDEGYLNGDTKCVRTTKLPKGTVIYVKVSNPGKKDSGYYQIKWK